jgi:GT2 family glycosyltransferase
MQLSIIIPTFNRNALLAEMLPYVYEAVAGVNAEIIIVNDSKTQKAIAPEGSPVPLRILDNPGKGPASARNFGVRHSKGKIILMIDDDVWVSKSSLEQTLKLHAQFPHSAFNPNWEYPAALREKCRATKFGRFLLHGKFDRYEGWVNTLDWTQKQVFEVPKLAGFHFSLEREDFDRSGGFKESFLFQGAEDSEFSKRLANTGVKMYVDPKTFVLHNEADRLTLRSRLNRTIASGYNRRTAMEEGLTDYSITYSQSKLRFYALVKPFKGLLLFSAGMLPNITLFDPLYRKLVGGLIGISLYQGYYLREKKMYRE